MLFLIAFHLCREKERAAMEKERAALQNIQGRDKYLPGEEEMRAQGRFGIIPIKPNRVTEFVNVAEHHYRYAESQFLR